MKTRAFISVLLMLLLCAACSGGGGGGGDSSPSSLAGHWTGRWTDSMGYSGDARMDLNQSGQRVWGTYEITNSYIKGPQYFDVTLPSYSTSGEFTETHSSGGITIRGTYRYDPNSIYMNISGNGYTVIASLHR